MSDYKQAIRNGERFQTVKGSLSTEQLFGLSLEDSNTLAVSLDDSIEKSKKKSFLEKRTTADKKIKLQFDIVIDVIQTLQKENDERKEAAENKLHNQKIDAIIASKKDSELAGKSVKELEKMRK